MIEGFDASGWSGEINFPAAKADGKQYGVYRVGRGKPDGATDAQGIDRFWFRNKSGSLSTDLKTGGYWRFFPDVDRSTQVSRFCLALGQRDGMLSPWVDVEDTGGLDPTSLTTWTIDVLLEVEQKCGRRPILYSGKNFYDNNLEYWRLYNWELCIAWQTGGNWNEYGSCFWQYLLDTPVGWAQGRVDFQKYAFNDLRLNTFNNELRYQIDDAGMFHGPLMWNGKLLPEASQQGPQSNQVAILHTMVGYLNGTDSYFRRGDVGLESHLGIGGKYDPPGLDGSIYQWIPTGTRADANYNANTYAFSIETSDGGGERYLEKWSGVQAESISQCLAAWCLKYNKPADLVSRAHSSVPGIGHHRIGTVPYVQPGDDYWSPPSEGPRSCPGQTRINQLVDEVIPRVKQILASLNPGDPGPEPPVEEPDMKPEDVIGVDKNGNPITVGNCLLAAFELKGHTDSLAASNKERLDNLMGSIHVTHDQSVWENASLQTWEELATKRWG